MPHHQDSIGVTGQRCLVLGGSGFIGMNLCKALATAGAYVRGFSTRPTSLQDVEWIAGDFTDASALERAVVNMDVVYHLISTSTPLSSNADPAMDAQQNIVSTLNLLDACRMAKVKRVVFVSSGGTLYGDAAILPTPETCPPAPRCAYGVSKLAIEMYLALYERLYGLESITLRVANPYGPYQFANRLQGVIGAFVNRTLSGETIQIWGDGSVVRDYIYIDDVVSALIKAASYTGTKRVFNIGSGKGSSLLQITESLAKAFGHPLEVRFEKGRSVDIPVSVLDSTLACIELDWRPAFDLDAGLYETVKWFTSLR